jgi:hypothetical protein
MLGAHAVGAAPCRVLPPPGRGPQAAVPILGARRESRGCVDCYHQLMLVRRMLERLGPRIGIGPCSNEVER